VGRRVLAWLGVASVVLLCQCTAVNEAPPQPLAHGRFEHLHIYRAQGEGQRLALLLSGDRGWSSMLGSIAQRLTLGGTLVAGIDSRALLASLSHDPASCVSPGADLAELSAYLRTRYQLPSAPAVLIGHSAGASLAFVALAQSSAGTFSGALTLSFCDELDLEKPLCRTQALHYRARAGGVRLLPAGPLPAPWIALHGLDDTECPAAEARAFAAATPGARFVGLPDLTHSYHHMNRWWGPFEAAYRELAAMPAAPASPAPASPEPASPEPASPAPAPPAPASALP
jgi:type IV secretory pathway VirJ component